MTTISRLKVLRQAYKIENRMMMDHWKPDVIDFFKDPGIESSFQSTWLKYLKAVCDSNDEIIDICDKGIAETITPDEATRLIVEVQHEEAKMKKFRDANNEGQDLSSYLSAVRDVLDLEYTVAKDIENFLKAKT